MKVACRKCPYFEKRKNGDMKSGSMIIGLCRLRMKLVSDRSINEIYCKDRAVISE